MSTRGFDVSTRRRLVACVVLVVLCRVAQGLFAYRPSWFFPAYRTLSKVWAGALALLCSLVPFTIWDIGILALVVLALVVLVRRLRAHEPLLPLLSWVLLGASCTYAAFALGWALNHYAPPLSGELGLEVRTYDTGELADATRAYLERAAQLAPQVPRDEHDRFVLTIDAEAECKRAMKKASEEYPQLRGYYPKPKPIMFSYFMSQTGTAGMYFPFSMESTYNADMVPEIQPEVICHEFAHLKGGAYDGMSTEQAFLALTSYYRFANSKTALYDFSDITFKENPAPEEPQQPDTNPPTGAAAGTVVILLAGAALMARKRR